MVFYERKSVNDMVNNVETILLVDDEEIIIDVGEELLKKVGYNVLSAGSGEEAIEIYKKSRSSIDLIILDMIMPGMDGDETYNRLKEINPKIRVILSSGYGVNDLDSEILNCAFDGFIQKPFNIKQLTHKIREILDDK